MNTGHCLSPTHHTTFLPPITSLVRLPPATRYPLGPSHRDSRCRQCHGRHRIGRDAARVRSCRDGRGARGAAADSRHHSPLTTRYSPLSTHHSPPTTQHTQLSTHRTPLTTHHSPVTAHRSPLTTRTGLRDPLNDEWAGIIRRRLGITCS